MIPVDKIKELLITIGFVIILMVALSVGLVRQAFGWLLMKLYQFFIGSKGHVSPN